MIKFKAFTGIDISKKTFDAALILAQTGVVYHQYFDQTKEEFRQPEPLLGFVLMMKIRTFAWLYSSTPN